MSASSKKARLSSTSAFIEDSYRHHLQLSAIALRYHREISSHPQSLLIQSNLEYAHAVNLKWNQIDAIDHSTHLHNRA